MNEQLNGNGHRPAFRISPSEPDLGQLILQARDEVVEDNNLSLGSRLMFVRILDLSVRQASNVRPGVVTISQMKLAEKFGVSERTVWAWRSELIRAKYVWLSKQWMPNSWPIDTYHVSLIHPPANSGDKTTVEGLWGNGKRRGEPVRGLGARQPGQVQIPGTGVRRNGLRLAKSVNVPGKSSVLLENATADRSQLRASTEAGFGSPPKQASAPNRSGLRFPTEADCDGEPKQVAVPNRSPLRPATETGCEHKKATGEGSSHSEGGRTPPPPPIDDKEAAFKKWEGRLDDMRNSDLRKLDEMIAREFRDAATDEAKAIAKRKLVAVRLRTRGPVASESHKPGPARVVKPVAPAKAVALTADEILEGARYLLSQGKRSSLTPAQRDALKAKGEL